MTQQDKDQKEVLQDAARALTGQPVRFTIEYKRSLWDRLLLRPAKRPFEIRPITLGTLARISEKLLSLSTGKVTMETLSDHFKLLEGNYEIARDHARTLAEIVALAITNEERLPAPALVDFLLWNLTPRELMALIKIVLRQMNLNDFTASIISVRGLNVLEEKPASVKSAEVTPPSHGS